jgi:hypothetical protein
MIAPKLTRSAEDLFGLQASTFEPVAPTIYTDNVLKGDNAFSVATLEGPQV